MKKPGPANYAESGQLGAEHRVRTGDLWQGADEDVYGDADCINLRNLSRLHLRKQELICQAMQRNARRLLTPD